MAAADNNVRPWRQAPAATARRARRSRLARLLLFSLALFQLDRKLLLLLAASFMPACIIPVGPEWHDPPGEKNQAPKIVGWEPFIGDDVVPGITAGVATAKFRIFVTDANAGDTLFFKWIANYTDPGQRRILNADTPKLLPVESGGQQPPVDQTLDCNDLNGLPSRNKIYVVVADRDFVDGSDPITIGDGGLYALANWTLTFPCQMQP